MEMGIGPVGTKQKIGLGPVGTKQVATAALKTVEPIRTKTISKPPFIKINTATRVAASFHVSQQQHYVQERTRRAQDMQAQMIKLTKQATHGFRVLRPTIAKRIKTD